jgi:hypothetical protein
MTTLLISMLQFSKLEQLFGNLLDVSVIGF